MPIFATFEGRTVSECKVWDLGLAFEALQAMGLADTKRTAERKISTLGLLPDLVTADTLRDALGRPPIALVLDWAIEQARRKREREGGQEVHIAALSTSTTAPLVTPHDMRETSLPPL